MPSWPSTEGVRAFTVPEPGSASPAPDLEARLRHQLEHGSSAQRRIAAYVLERADEAAFTSAAELAVACGTSAATVVRFAQGLGFTGFPAFRHALQATLRSRLSLPERLERRPRPDDDDPLARARASLALDARLLSHAADALDAAALVTLADRLSHARHVHVVGLRGSAALADLLGLLLRKAGLDARSHTCGDVTLFDGLRYLDERDVLVVFSFARYARRASDALDLARRRGAHAVAITDSPLSPPARAAQRALVVGVGSLAFQHSYVTAVAVINALIALVTLADEARTLASLDAFEQVLPADDLLAP